MKRIIPVLLTALLLLSLFPAPTTFADESEENLAVLATVSVEETELPIETFASAAAENQRYPQDENGRYLVVENYKDKITKITDAQLFGVYKDGSWTTKPQLRYEDFPDLAATEAAAMEGDYSAAKAELLEYYRVLTRNRKVPEPVRMAAGNDRGVTRLLRDNIFFSPIGASLVNEFTFTPQEKEVSIDLFGVSTSRLDKLRTMPVLELVAKKRDGSGASLVRNGIGAPRLEVMVNGELIVLNAIETGTMRAGTYKDTAFPDEDRLYVKESTTGIKTVTEKDLVIEDYHEPVPIDDNTERTLIKFDLSTIPTGQNVTSAVIKLTGHVEGVDEARPYLCFVSNSSSWTERNLCWNSKEHYIGVYDGEPYGRYFLPWQDGFSRDYRDRIQRFEGFMPYATTTYLASEGEEAEDCAYDVLTQICGFFDQLGNVSTMAHTSNADKWNSSKYGRNSLDIGSRMQSWVNEFWQFIDSRHMTPEIWTSFIKYMYRSGDALNKDRNYHPANNWGVIETLGLFIAATYTDELRNSAEWMHTVNSRIYNADQVEDDLASVEIPLLYAQGTTLKNLFNYQTFAETIGKKVDYSDELITQMVNLYKYLIYASGPGFVCLQMGDDGSHKDSVLFDPHAFTSRFPDPNIVWAATGGEKGTAPVFTSHRYLSNRNYIMRNGWGAKDMYLETNMNAGYKSHGHDDDLGIIAFAYGQYLLADCGYDSLQYGSESREWLESSRAHNTVEVNRKTQLRDKVRGDENAWVTNGAYDFFSGTTTRNTDAAHTRNILYVRDGYWLVTDFMEPNNGGENSYVQIWHMKPDAGITMDETTKAVRTNFADANIQVVPANQDSYDRSEIVTGYYSETKGKLTDADYVEYEKKTSGRTNFLTALVPEDAGDKKQVFAVEIALSDVTESGAAAMQLTIDGSDKIDATYYTVRDIAQIKEREVGEYRTNGTMMYVEQTNGKLSKLFAQNTVGMADGTLIETAEGEVLLKSETSLPQISVVENGSIVEISTGYTADQVNNTVTYLETDLSTLKVSAPQYTERVFVNGKQVKFHKKDGYLYLGDGESNEQKPSEPDKPSAPSGGGHGSVMGGGGNSQIVTPPQVNIEPTPDVPPEQLKKEALKQTVKGHWAERELCALIDGDVIEGSDDGLNLSGKVTRAEFTTMVTRALGLDQKPYDGAFSDVYPGDWYADTIQSAVNSGLIHGYGDGTFRPDERISREEMAAVAAAATGGESRTVQTEFSDSAEFSGWSLPLISAVVERGLMDGFPDGSFRSNALALREQAMVLTYRLIQWKNRTEKG